MSAEGLHRHHTHKHTHRYANSVKREKERNERNRQLAQHKRHLALKAFNKNSRNLLTTKNDRHTPHMLPTGARIGPTGFKPPEIAATAASNGEKVEELTTKLSRAFSSLNHQMHDLDVELHHVEEEERHNIEMIGKELKHIEEVVELEHHKVEVVAEDIKLLVNDSSIPARSQETTLRPKQVRPKESPTREATDVKEAEKVLDIEPGEGDDKVDMTWKDLTTEKEKREIQRKREMQAHEEEVVHELMLAAETLQNMIAHFPREQRKHLYSLVTGTLLKAV